MAAAACHVKIILFPNPKQTVFQLAARGPLTPTNFYIATIYVLE